MKIVSTRILVSSQKLEATYNSVYGCRDNCLDACQCIECDP